MRILDIINTSASADALLRARVLALRELGFDDHIACAAGPHVDRLRDAGIPVHVIDIPRGLDPVRLVLAFARLVLLMRSERFDIVHTHCSVPGVVGRLAASCAGVPVVVHTVHGYHWHDRVSTLRRRCEIAVERWCGRLTTVLLTQNRGDLALSIALDIGVPGRRKWIGNGIDLARFTPVGEPPVQDTVVVTCVARLEPVKNHAALIEAAALMRDRGLPFELWLVGEGPLLDPLVARVRALRLTDRVRFLGRREDVPALLARSHIAVLPSVKEGIPRALIEAMAMGLPTVATSVPGNVEVVRHQEEGLLVPLDDISALAAAIGTLIEDPALRRRLGRRGRQRALDEFDEREIVRRLGDLYSSLAPNEVPSARPAGAGQDVPAAVVSGPEPERTGLARTALFRLTGQVVSAALNVAGLAMLGHALGAERYGEYAFYYAWIPLVASVSDAGVGMMVTRDIAQRPGDGPRLLGEGIVIKGAVLVVLLLCATMLMTVRVPMLSGLAGSALLFLVVATAAIDMSQDPTVWVLRARGRADLEARLLVGCQLLWLCLLAVGLALHASLFGLLAATSIAYGVRVLIGMALTRRLWGGPELRIETPRLRRLVRQGLPFAGAMLAMVVYGRIGLMLLKGLAAARDVGCFQIAFLLSQPFGFIASSVTLAAFPQLARERGGDPHAVKRRIDAQGRWLTWVGGALATALFLGADPLIALLFPGRDYRPAATALRWLALALPLTFNNLHSRYVLAALGRQRGYLVAAIAGCVTNAALCVLLIPREGLVGACVAYLAAELVVFMLCGAEARRAVRRTERPQRLGPAVVAMTTELALDGMAGTKDFVRLPGSPERRRVRGVMGAGHRQEPVEALSLPRGRTSPERGARRLELLATGGSDLRSLPVLDSVARLDCVRHVLALPDLHMKDRMETPSSVAIATRGALVPEFTSVAVNDGMGVMLTDLELKDLTPERITRFFRRLSSHAAAHPLDLNRYSLSPADLEAAALEGGGAVVRRYGLDSGVLSRMEHAGRYPVEPPPNALRSIVPWALQRSRLARAEMGLNFGGNHFLELQVVDRVIDPAAARAWGLSADRVVVMYHLGPGPFSGTLLHHYSRREKLSAARAAALLPSKLALHFLQRSGLARPPAVWDAHFRRHRWTVLPEGSEGADAFVSALTLAMNFGYAYRLATVAAVRDTLEELFAAHSSLLCDVAHNGIWPERVAGEDVWVARHNACRREELRPAIVAGANDVCSFLARGATGGRGSLHSYDHGAGHLIERWRCEHSPSWHGAGTLKVHATRGRDSRIAARELPPLQSPKPIEGLMHELQQHGVLQPVVRLQPLATLKNGARP